MTNETAAAGLDFGEAIRALKAGHRVAREGWNGKGMWLILAASSVAAVREHGADQLNRLVMLPHIVMKTAQAQYVPWLASQTDMLADDWQDLDAPAEPLRKRYTRFDVHSYVVQDDVPGWKVKVYLCLKDGKEVRHEVSFLEFAGLSDMPGTERHEYALKRALAVANGEQP